MITPRQILRHARAERFGTLLDAVLSNGRSCPLTLRLHLEQDADWTLASLALGAMRTLELTFPISFEASEMLDRLADALRARGVGGPVPARTTPNPRSVSPTALAASAAALAAAIREADGLPRTQAHDALVARLRAALDDAGAGLARWQWSGSTSTEADLWSDARCSSDRVEDAAACTDPIDVAAVLWLARDHAHDIPHADIPALTSMAEAMGLTHDRVLGPVVRAAL
jgi:hypothetical protein